MCNELIHLFCLLSKSFDYSDRIQSLFSLCSTPDKAVVVFFISSVINISLERTKDKSIDSSDQYSSSEHSSTNESDSDSAQSSTNKVEHKCHTPASGSFNSSYVCVELSWEGFHVLCLVPFFILAKNSFEVSPLKFIGDFEPKDVEAYSEHEAS